MSRITELNSLLSHAEFQIEKQKKYYTKMPKMPTYEKIDPEMDSYDLTIEDLINFFKVMVSEEYIEVATFSVIDFLDNPCKDFLDLLGELVKSVDGEKFNFDCGLFKKYLDDHRTDVTFINTFSEHSNGCKRCQHANFGLNKCPKFCENYIYVGMMCDDECIVQKHTLNNVVFDIKFSIWHNYKNKKCDELEFNKLDELFKLIPQYFDHMNRGCL